MRAAIVALHGERYLSTPHAHALRLLFARPKVHATHDTLIDPRTGSAFNVLAPGDLTMARAGTA